MSNPKRKVTDLLPSEAILISSDAERDAVLKLFQEAGIKWNSGKMALSFKPKWIYPYSINIFCNKIAWQVPVEEGSLPATDFIPTESDEVEEGSTIESVFKLAKWILENRVSLLIDADIPQEDKDRIARHFGYSADLTNP